MAIQMARLADPWSLRHLTICVRRLDALPVHAQRLVEHLRQRGPKAPGDAGALSYRREDKA